MVKEVKTPYAKLLPGLSHQEFEALRQSIKNEGVRDPILIDEDGAILDGHNRHKIDPDAPTRTVSGLSPAEKEAFVIRVNLSRRNLSPSQRRILERKTMRRVALELRKEDAKKNTQERVARLLGVARETVRNWFMPNGQSANTHSPDARVKIPVTEYPKILKRHQDGESQESIADDYHVDQSAISRIITKETKAEQKRAQRRLTIAKLDSEELGIHHGDFREAGNIVPDDSVDLVFCDPPYDEESVPMYRDLAVYAARILRPGGWCLAYSGHTFLPQIIDHMRESLTYGWTFGIQHTGGDLRYRKLKLQNKWKPILGFYRPPLEVWWDWFPDFTSGGKEKDAHEWQQATAEAEHFIRGLSPEDGLVVDPFCGSGTTCVAAKTAGRRWIAFDTKLDSVEKARERIHDSTAA